MKSLALSLITKGKIKTTDAKARELRPYAEKLITTGKLGTVAARRAALTKLGVAGSKYLVDTVAPKYSDRNGGYTRITKLQARTSDGSLMAIIELV